MKILVMSIQVEESKKTLSLVVSQRAVVELGKVYQYKEAFVRELIQNAIDSGATKMIMSIEKNIDGTYFVFEHNGIPIEGRYLDSFLEIGTDFKAGKSGFIGQYGIGRLSWLMVGDRAIIETGNHRLIWDKDRVLEIDVEEMPERFNGVRWKVRLTEPLDMKAVEDYIYCNYYGGIPIYVKREDGELREVKNRLEGAVPFVTIGDTKVYKVERYSADIVKGVFRAGESFSFYQLGLIIMTNDPRVKINPARDIIRDSDYEKWEGEVARAVLGKIKEVYTADEAKKRFGSLTLYDVAVTAFPMGNIFNESETKETYWKRLSFVPFETGDGMAVWGDSLSPDKWLYSLDRLTDDSVQSLEQRGFYVFYLPSQSIRHIFESLGFKDAAKEVIISNAKAVKAAELEEKLAKVYEVVDRVLSGFSRPVDQPGSGGGSAATASVRTDSGEYSGVVSRTSEGITIVYNNDNGEKSLLRLKVVGALRGVPVVFVEANENDFIACTDGKYIYLNLKSPEVAERVVISKNVRSPAKLLILWGPYLLHEALHKKFGLNHTSRLWGELYEKGIREINKTAFQMLLEEQRGSRSKSK